MGENKARKSFGSRLGFVLSAAGSAVGLGNLRKFPYLAGTNGGSIKFMSYGFWKIMMKIIAPLAILYIFITGLKY